MNLGAREARGDLLWFLHADCRPDKRVFSAIRRAASRACAGAGGLAGAFSFEVDSNGLSYRPLVWGVALRNLLFRLPYGDQGIFISRARFLAMGGYRELPFMEDVEFALRLRRTSCFRILPERLSSSPRRWEKGGLFRRSLLNVWLVLAYLAGASPETLATRYRSH